MVFIIIVLLFFLVITAVRFFSGVVIGYFEDVRVFIGKVVCGVWVSFIVFCLSGSDG